MRNLLYSILLFLLTFDLNAQTNTDQMIVDLQVIKHLLEVSYAPTNWKKDHLDWDLEIAFEDAKIQIISTPEITLKQYQQILKKFLNTTQDFHINISFFSTEEALLPFQVKTVDHRTFIDWIDPSDGQTEGMKVGDELIEFDGRPITEVFKEIKIINGLNSNPMTNQAIADLNLTSRSGTRGEVVPSGAVLITLRNRIDGKCKTYQLTWDYKSERINLPPYLMRSRTTQKSISEETTPRKKLGSKYSFVPKLGKVTWKWKEKRKREEEIENPFWNAYIYQNQDGRSIGCIRIPHYNGSPDDLENFAKIISQMEEKTEALVIDQVNNTGGDLEFLYHLASMLINKSFSPPKHRVKITQKDVYDALSIIEYFEAIENDKRNAEDYETLVSEKRYWESLIQEWNEGRNLTHPLYLFGIEKIKPSLEANYTKPILFLINELDFSGGDFMPAILQDNQRAVLFGTQTAGAGGAAKDHVFPNEHGIAYINYTWTIAERADFQKIENLGVKPDIEYKIGINDIQNQYADYGKAVNAEISKMLPIRKKKDKKKNRRLQRSAMSSNERLFSSFAAGVAKSVAPTFS